MNLIIGDEGQIYIEPEEDIPDPFYYDDEIQLRYVQQIIIM